ncbi:MAG TPA: tyrosine-protein phosphatase [Steroidobacteraceae bacterium]|nr:tyrosine-protein phosphatase [Steroidobacteraceae bacterium]
MGQLPEMAVNLRELGGIATADGRRIRRGIIYRSGDLADRFTSIEGYLTRVLNFDAHSLRRMRDQTLE